MTLKRNNLVKLWLEEEELVKWWLWELIRFVKCWLWKVIMNDMKTLKTYKFGEIITLKSNNLMTFWLKKRNILWNLWNDDLEKI